MLQPSSTFHNDMPEVGTKYPASPVAKHEDWKQRVDENLSLVRRLARRTAEGIQRLDLIDDLLQAGFFGLVEASRRYNRETGKPFQAFAQPRIQGAMIDEIRKLDWRPRRVSRSAARISRHMSRVEQQLGRQPTELEVAQSLGLSLQAYQQELEGIACGQLEAFIEEPSEEFVDDSFCSVEQRFYRGELKERLASAVDRLPAGERQLLGFYYQQGLNQCEIAEVFHVTEARVSQIHKQALLRLKAYLGGQGLV
ncbi:FliA/WhiG family RNA polymerase sigma factor [Sansalvadorimonas sp. 2012CJ34-2]|uniref:FliA/WhiG family RNA polymerase sigma factor n=1 Tax=Parendozoicomonas callyspongiae TaxID=2942213 RepID=A0ABT0PDX7_9GAMM|nr:FliA/WhiG family RNA polymerase sigma factor [Sansalvadorimonas sp. 2012CJ34-2]MCL6269564.1 FliA/WhiG family RNA polymerase sigma factor [Sansalvadorimonas sp. 2012CJ34-2]